MSVGRLFARAFLVLSAVTATVAVAAWAQFTEPWPLSRRHGPDTEFARALFRRVVDQDVPAGVHRLSGREEWGFGGDSIYSLQFAIDEPGVAETIAAALGLSLVPARDVSRLRYFEGPAWWPAEPEIRRVALAYARVDVVLWVDAERRQAYLQKAGFAPAMPSR